MASPIVVALSVRGLEHGPGELKLRWPAPLAMRWGGVQRPKGVRDWEQNGGALIRGRDRILMEARGRSRARATANAGTVAAKAVAHGRGRAIRESFC